MTKRNNIFFTSDLHIGHENVMKFDDRPWDSLEAMHKGLIKRFNATVPEGGLTYFLGDIGLTKGDTVKNVIDQLNGTKVLIIGNHDKGPRAMARLGFDLVLNMASITLGKEIITMTHQPLRGVKRENTAGMRGTTATENWHGESRENSRLYSIPDWGQFHLHGHIHSPNSGKSQKILGRQFDVGVAANGYAPVSMAQIESWIFKTKKEELA